MYFVPQVLTIFLKSAKLLYPLTTIIVSLKIVFAVLFASGEPEVNPPNRASSLKPRYVLLLSAYLALVGRIVKAIFCLRIRNYELGIMNHSFSFFDQAITDFADFYCLLG